MLMTGILGERGKKDLLDWLFAHVFKEEPSILLILRASEVFPKTNSGISSTFLTFYRLLLAGGLTSTVQRGDFSIL